MPENTTSAKSQETVDNATSAEKPEVLEAGQTTKPKGLVAFIDSLSAREKNIGIVTGLFLALLILDLAVVRPVNGHLDHLKSVIQEKESLIPKRLLVLGHKDRILNENNAYESFVQQNAVSQEEEIAGFLRTIESVSQRAGMFISNINPVQTEEIPSQGRKLTVEVEGVGNIGAIKNFVNELETANAPMRVVAMNLRSQGPDNADLRYKFKVIKLGLTKHSLS